MFRLNLHALYSSIHFIVKGNEDFQSVPFAIQVKQIN